MKLDIGYGGQPRDESYTTVDLHVDADIKTEMWDIPLPDGYVDEIWSSHALEHIPGAKVNATLKEWLRLLKPGGRAIVSVPNFDYVAKYWLTGPDRAWAEAMVFGLQTHEGEFHRCGFTASLLRGDCEAAGFEVLRVEMRWTHNQETLQATLQKPEEKQ